MIQNPKIEYLILNNSTIHTTNNRETQPVDCGDNM